MLGGALVALLAASACIVLFYPAAPPGRGADPTAYFTAGEIARGRGYSRGGYAIALSGAGLRLGVLAVLVFTPLSTALRDAALAVGRRPWLAAALYAAGVLVLLVVVRFPLAFYGGYLRERAWGLSTQTLPAWLAA